MATGELVAALAMTEPGAGSDLQSIKTRAERSGNGWVVNGSKTFITNGQHANLVVVAAQTQPGAGAKGNDGVAATVKNTAGEVDAEELHRSILCAQQMMISEVLDTERWLSRL